VDTPQQNGIAGRKIAISLRLLEIYFSKRLFLDLTGEEGLIATYLINRLPSRVVEVLLIFSL